MSITCVLGFHKWEGCKCLKCGKTRDEDHDWGKSCEKCTRCGATRQNAHQWQGCKCSACRTTRDEGHDWSKDCEKCSHCGATRTAHKWSKYTHKCEACGAEAGTLVFDGSGDVIGHIPKPSLLIGTEIYLEPDNEVSGVHVMFPTQEDFLSWCRTRGFYMETQWVDAGTTITSATGASIEQPNIQKWFLRSKNDYFAKVEHFSADEIDLVSAGNADFIQEEFMMFCREAYASSRMHRIFLREKQLDDGTSSWGWKQLDEASQQAWTTRAVFGR